MAFKKLIAVLIMVIVLMAALVAGLVLSRPSDKGALSIYVKDDPAVWSHVNVTFSEVQVHSAQENASWTALGIRNGTIDLAVLTNASELLASAELPTGKYTQIRLVVTSATGVMANGTEVTFDIPSGELKTTHPFEIVAGGKQAFTLEIDLDQSITNDGSGWKFRPVLGSIAEA